MALQIGDKIGSYTVIALPEDGVTAECSMCGDITSIYHVSEEDIIKAFRALSCNSAMNNNLGKVQLYVGKKIGSFIITEIREADYLGMPLYTVKAQCVVCKSIITAEYVDQNEEDIRTIVAALLAWSCRTTIEPEVYEVEKTKIKNYKTNVTHQIDKSGMINGMKQRIQEKKIKEIREKIKNNTLSMR